MSKETMNFIYFISIALFGVVMIFSPRTFMGRAKYDEDAIKTEKLIKKCGIGIIAISTVLILISVLH